MSHRVMSSPSGHYSGVYGYPPTPTATASAPHHSAPHQYQQYHYIDSRGPPPLPNDRSYQYSSPPYPSQYPQNIKQPGAPVYGVYSGSGGDYYQSQKHKSPTQSSMTQSLSPSLSLSTSSLLDLEDDPLKKKRKRTSPDQLKILERIFISHQHPSLNLRNQLAIELGMTPRSVQIWFQNRRAKARNMEFKPPLAGVLPEHLYDSLGLSSIKGDVYSNLSDKQSGSSSPGDKSPSVASYWNRILLHNGNPEGLLRYNPEDPNSIDVNLRDNRGLSLLFTAAVLGYEYQARKLVESGADPNIRDNQGNTPILASSLLGSLHIVEYLLQHGADPNLVNNDGISPLYGACKSGHTSIVRCLLDNHAEVSTRLISNDETPLHVATLKGSERICQMLLENDAKPTVYDVNNYTPLHHASIMGYIGIAKLLVKYGADLEAVDNLGHTPLHTASLLGNDLIVSFLLEKGANLNKQDNEGSTPIHYAIREGRIETVKILIKNGANLDLSNCDKQNALHYFVQFGTVMMGQLISENYHGDMDALDIDGHTPLYLASKAGKFNFVKYLIGKGASVQLTLDIMQREGEDKQIMEILLKNSTHSGGQEDEPKESKKRDRNYDSNGNHHSHSINEIIDNDNEEFNSYSGRIISNSHSYHSQHQA